jgi:hypothetical protein
VRYSVKKAVREPLEGSFAGRGETTPLFKNAPYSGAEGLF